MKRSYGIRGVLIIRKDKKRVGVMISSDHYNVYYFPL